MQKFNCLIVEDEPLAAEILEDYIKDVPFLKLIAKCNDAVFAVDILQNEKIDVIFLDIHLPKIKGIDFLKSISNLPKVIITSAYHEYALDAYELNVVDYLLKPIEFSRFLKAVNKLNHLSDINRDNKTTATESDRAYVYFNVSKRKVKIFLDEILYIESIKEYVRIITKDKEIITKFQIGEIHQLLNDINFLRIHRAFIVAKHKIEAFSATDVEINGKQIPIGRSYKESIISSLEDGNQ